MARLLRRGASTFAHARRLERRSARMPSSLLPSSRHNAPYRIRILAGLATSLAAANLAVGLWPERPLREPPEIRDARPREQIVIEMIEPTRQPPPSEQPPAPPPPPVADLPPVEVPDEQILREIEREIPLRTDAPPLPEATTPTGPPAPPAPPAPPTPPPGPPGPSPSSDRIVERPQRSPRIVRTSPPVCPPDVRRDGVTVTARVRTLVSQGGQVETAEITERTVTDRRGREQAVATLPYNLDAAVLEAARRHLFRPAQDGEQRVRSYTTLTLRCSASG